MTWARNHCAAIVVKDRELSIGWLLFSAIFIMFWAIMSPCQSQPFVEHAYSAFIVPSLHLKTTVFGCAIVAEIGLLEMYN